METLETSYGTFNVYVNYLTSSEESLIHISFVDKSGKTHIILMKRLAGTWVCINPEEIPQWILDLKEQFNALITREALRTYEATMTEVSF
jgi:hypothetical protein